MKAKFLAYIPEAWIGGGGFIATLTAQDAFAGLVALATVFALLPLGLSRWRAYLRDKPATKNED